MVKQQRNRVKFDKDLTRYAQVICILHLGQNTYEALIRICLRNSERCWLAPLNTASAVCASTTTSALCFGLFKNLAHKLIACCFIATRLHYTYIGTTCLASIFHSATRRRLPRFCLFIFNAIPPNWIPFARHSSQTRPAVCIIKKALSKKERMAGKATRIEMDGPENECHNTAFTSITHSKENIPFARSRKGVVFMVAKKGAAGATSAIKRDSFVPKGCTRKYYIYKKKTN